MDIDVLGPFRVHEGRTPIALTAAKPRTLFALLALHSDRALPRTALLAELWGEDQPRSAVTTLHTYVAYLRRLLGRALPSMDAKLVLRTVRTGYVLDRCGGRLDAEEFERRAAIGLQAFSEGQYGTAGTLFREALALWRGPALDDVRPGPLLSAAISRLEQSRLTVVRQRIDCDLQNGRHVEVIDELADLTARYPDHDGFRRQLLTARCRADERPRGLRAPHEPSAPTSPTSRLPDTSSTAPLRRIAHPFPGVNSVIMDWATGIR